MARTTRPRPSAAAPAAAPRNAVPPAAAAPAAGLAGGAGLGAGSRWNQSGPFSTAGGVILGVLGVTLFVQYSRGGAAEVKRWLTAKFLNNQTAAGAVGSTIGKGAGLIGTIYGGAGGADAGAAAGAPPANPVPKGGLLP